ncbi:MAG TPA: ABC transporter ATP-binding protein [Gemmatimonadales bacterium]|nr:ABC transporter ATP-binding protein [Gemmatimonadales bacterium]
MTAAVRIAGLEKVYPPGVRAIGGLDLEVRQGEIFGLLGPNGAGKSTTVGVCTTRILPTAGRVEIEGIDVVSDPVATRRRIGVVTQYNTLDRACTVQENLYYHCRYFGMGGVESRRRVAQLLEQFRLGDRADQFPAQLSGGLAQRVQIARAIAHQPRVLFLDEPSAGLDPQSRLALWDLVLQLRDEGLTVLLTTHQMEEADRLSHRLAIIDHGRVLVSGTPEELKRQVAAATVLELHLERPTAALAERLRALPGVAEVALLEKGIRVMASTRALLPKAVEIAQEAGLHDLSITEPTLETVFITLTGRELRD